MALHPSLRPLLPDFVTEARLQRDAAGDRLLELERGVAPEIMAESYETLARVLHTLKGTSATFGLRDVSEIARAAEELLHDHGRAGGRLAPHVGAAVRHAIELVIERLTAYAEDRADALPDVAAALASLEEAMRGVPEKG